MPLSLIDRQSSSSSSAYRADLIARYVRATDWAEEMHLLAEATRYDRDNRGAPSLVDELHGARLGDAA
ncbi:hypothetical protein EST92_11660 [Streptomyces sp. TM32]|uniref:hypothetical protein n=1 Tax=Streptomyces sp. TM32 TaxID=1652669 RepID=UPI0010101F23|nr:hypothetical protein [Streptomyces sp. TM32]RXS84207.1 hypothetical protein EST92_11660 [Streptomyces sp. TM32]